MRAAAITPLPSLVQYNDAWNSEDPDAVAQDLAAAVTDDVHFVDPANQRRGRDDLADLIVEARATFPGARYEVTSGIDGHNRRYRYLWVARLDAVTAVPGMDVTTVAEDGRIMAIDGFFGDFPPLD